MIMNQNYVLIHYSSFKMLYSRSCLSLSCCCRDFIFDFWWD